MSKTTPTHTYCKRNRPLPYYHPNCRTSRHWKFNQDHRTTRPSLTLQEIDLMQMSWNFPFDIDHRQISALINNCHTAMDTVNFVPQKTIKRLMRLQQMRVTFFPNLPFISPLPGMDGRAVSRDLKLQNKHKHMYRTVFLSQWNLCEPLLGIDIFVVRGRGPSNKW